MKPFIQIVKYYKKEKNLGINLCYEENSMWNMKKGKLLTLKYKEIYVNVCLIWINIAIGIKTKPREE